MSEPIEEENDVFESAVKVTPTSKATQTIIPGAAYLSPSEKRIYIGGRFSRLFTNRGKIVYGGTPTDLILLYAPGDKVLVDKGWTADDRWTDRVIVHRGADV